jgi:hypothetical protein
VIVIPSRRFVNVITADDSAGYSPDRVCEDAFPIVGGVLEDLVLA